MIDSLALSQAGGWTGIQLLLWRLWLQMKSPMHDGSAPIQEILATVGGYRDVLSSFIYVNDLDQPQKNGMWLFLP